MIEIMEKGVAVLVSIIPQGDEDTIPECNSDCGKDGISRKRLFGRTGDKSDVCAAEWNYAGEADCVIPLCRTYIAFVAGSSKQSFPTYAIFSAIGITLWNSVLITLGYYGYQYRDTFFHYFNQYKTIILVVGVGLLVLLLFPRREWE